MNTQPSLDQHKQDKYGNTVFYEKTISYTVYFTFLPNKVHFKVLYIHMYDYLKDKITTVINIM